MAARTASSEEIRAHVAPAVSPGVAGETILNSSCLDCRKGEGGHFTLIDVRYSVITFVMCDHALSHELFLSYQRVGGTQ